MKKCLTALLTITLSGLLFAGCGSKSAGEQTEAPVTQKEALSDEEIVHDAEEKTIRIAYSLDQMSEGNAVVVDGMEQWVEEYNATSENEKIELTVFDANANVEKQISDVDTIIVDGYDILVFSCVDTEGSMPAMEAADAAGLIVVDVRDTGSDAADVRVTVQDEKVMTDTLRAWMQEKLDEDPELVWNVGIIYGTAAQTLQLERGDFVKRFAEEEERVNAIVDAYGNWDTAVAMGLTEDWLQVYDDINLVVCANIGMAQGASAALQASNVKDEVKVITFDITDDTVLNIRDGVIDASVGCDMIDIGRIYAEIGVQVYHGDFTEDVFVNSELSIVDSDNYEDFLK
ncbi:MAG: sugar ABC transporter substrate-binding protein [Lachnospiraceae bacterium]|nr:sugar ABC transporter substrate-binding protein [Lachnospiraceae bacterium]